MRRYCLPVFAAFSIGCNEADTGDPTSAAAAFTNPRRVIILGYEEDAMEPFLSRDGRYMFFNNLNDLAVNTNLHWAQRVDDSTFQHKGEISGTSSPVLDAVASMCRDSVFFFVSTRSYDQTASTLYRGSFSNGIVSQVELVSGVATATPGIVNFDAEISADCNTLYFAESQWGSAGPQTADILIAEQKGSGFQRNSNSIMQRVNTSALEYAPATSALGLEILFTRFDGNTPAIYAATRTSTSGPFDAPRRIQAITGFVEAPTYSPDERSIYYHKKENNQFVVYRVTRP